MHNRRQRVKHNERDFEKDKRPTKKRQIDRDRDEKRNNR